MVAPAGDLARVGGARDGAARRGRAGGAAGPGGRHGQRHRGAGRRGLAGGALALRRPALPLSAGCRARRGAAGGAPRRPSCGSSSRRGSLPRSSSGGGARCGSTGCRGAAGSRCFGLLALAVGFAPFGHLVDLGNWTVASAAALPLALLFVCRGRWVAAGLVIGAAVAVKPLLAPVVLLFVFARAWRALGAVVLVPAVVSAGAALAMPDPAGFFTRTLPFLLRGDDAFVRLYEASPAAVLPRLGVPQGAARCWPCGRRVRGCGVRGGAGGAGSRGGAGGRDGRDADAGRLPGVQAVVRPLSAGRRVAAARRGGEPGAVARGPWFWLALVPQVPGFAWPWLEPGTRRAFRDFVTLCVLALTVWPFDSVARACVRGERRGDKGGTDGEPGRGSRPGAVLGLRGRVLTRTGRRG